MSSNISFVFRFFPELGSWLRRNRSIALPYWGQDRAAEGSI